jgi:hypothetical protein
MRWEDLFADLEGQLSAEEAVALSAEVADRTRREQARIRLADRLRAAEGARLVVDVQGVGQLTGRVAGVGPDWLLLDDGVRELLVPVGALRWVSGLGRLAADPQAQGAVAARLTLGYALRALARDRAVVSLVLRDGGALTGTVDRVLADHLDLAEHPVDEPRRAGAVRAVRSVPLEALAVVRH